MRTHTVLCIVGVLALGVPTLASAPDSSGAHYQGIALRNVFGLMPPVTTHFDPPPAPLPKIVLTGITTILGEKRALIKLLTPARPGERPAEVAYLLREGQREGNLEVLRIDDNAAFVILEFSGATLTLTFEKDGPKEPISPAPTPLPNPARPAPVAQFSVEQQEVFLELQREQNQRNPQFPPLPPPSLTPALRTLSR